MSIEVRHINKTFGNFAALKDVSLKIDDGKLVALLGPSGSGKTTLLRIIAGLETPDPTQDSAVLFHEEDVSRRPVRGRRVGFVFQHYALFRHMTVFENIAFGLRVKPWGERPGRKEIAERVHRLLKLVQLDSLADRYPSQLSGGQRQRIALARALAVEPRVLLLDEPFGALDAQVRQELRQWLRRLHDELHVTSVFVTHDQEEALEVSDRVVVMNQGQIVQSGTPEEVFHHPASEFVVRFLGRVNVFHGRTDSGQVHFSNVALDIPESQRQEGRPAQVFVRPHEWEVETHANGDPSCRAVIRHINPAGAQTRLSLTTDAGEPVEVELSYERFQELAILAGDTVYLVPRRVKVFVDGQAVAAEPAGSEEKRQASRSHLETGP